MPAEPNERRFCPICDLVDTIREFPQARGPGRRHPLVRCRRCDLVFQERIGTPDDTQPEQHSADGGSQNRFAPWLERVVRLFRLSRVRLAIRLMPTGGRVLDIGCGRGVYLRMLRERGYQVRGQHASI